MKKFLNIFIVLVLGSNIYGQKFDGYVVTNANDTIHCKFFVQTNLFNDKIFYATSVYKKVIILTNKGDKKKYFPKDLKCFYISGTTDGNFKFVSFKYDNYKHFYHEVVGDRLSYYRLHNQYNSYRGVNQTYKEFIFKDESFLELGLFNTRKNLAKLIEDNKIIYDKWMDENGYYKLRDAFNIINQYNNFYKN